MIESKHRAWIYAEAPHGMYVVAGICWATKQVYVYDRSDTYKLDKYHPVSIYRVALMQCTFRTSRDDEDIYIDDIVQIHDGSLHRVKSISEAFGYAKIVPYDSYEACDIVGNIHESPKLVEKMAMQYVE